MIFFSIRLSPHHFCPHDFCQTSNGKELAGFFVVNFYQLSITCACWRPSHLDSPGELKKNVSNQNKRSWSEQAERGGGGEEYIAR